MKLKRNFIAQINDWTGERPLSVMGPTGSGKTAIVLEFLAKSRFAPLLVSLDSVAAYTELNIGTAKPTGPQRSNHDWCGLDIASITAKVDVSVMKTAVLPRILAAQGRTPILFVGGTHFYERFILAGSGPGQASDEEFIRQLERDGMNSVRAQLIAHDPRWSILHANDHYRIARFGDLVLRQRLTFDQLKDENVAPLFPEIDTLIIPDDRGSLDARLSARIDAMLAQGWVAEVETLLTTFSSALPAFRSIGYNEIVEYLARSPGQNRPSDLEALRARILIRHRQLAKQQRTWIRRLKGS